MTSSWLSTMAFAGGLAALYLGAEALVRGSVALARELDVAPFTVGVTIVAFGGSAPELAIGILASLQEHGALVAGNVIGSNVANLALIMGLCAAFRAVPVSMRLVRHEIPIMVAAALLLGILALDGRIGRLEGGVFLVAFAAFIWRIVVLSRQAPPGVEQDYRKAVTEIEREVGPRRARRRSAAVLAGGGIAGLVLGAQLLVSAATYFAARVGVSEAVVGFTVVALGTSLPELATSLVAVLRGNSDIALGNIVGSNVFNVFAILGLAALIEPVELDQDLLRIEIPFSIVISAVFLPLAITRARLERWEGGLLVLAYAAFLWLVSLRIVG